MDVTGIASMATQFSDAKTADQIQVTVLKKALDAQAESAAQLIQALPQPASVNQPAHLGQNVNTSA